MVSGNDVNVEMKNRLTGGFPDIDTDVESIRMRPSCEVVLHKGNGMAKIFENFRRRFNPAWVMVFRNDEKVAFRDGVVVIGSVAMFCLVNDVRKSFDGIFETKDTGFHVVASEDNFCKMI